jgi:hypothetical protein
MTPEKDAELVAKYPEIFAEAYNGRFGFECGDGWFELIDNLCSLLMIDESLTPVATQVKEKFGALRFYVNEATDYQYELIDRAGTLSQHTCEVCGAPGTADYKRSWIKTLCEEHTK